MAQKPQVGVIGLGKFGYTFGMAMLNFGHKVLGIDREPENIQRAQKVFTQVFQADATQKQALEQMGVADMTHVLVSVGNSIAASTMISMYLKELGIKNVWVKAITEDHCQTPGQDRLSTRWSYPSIWRPNSWRTASTCPDSLKDFLLIQR